MENRYVIGLDVGTTSVKGVLVSEEGELYSRSSREYTLETKGDICELDPEIYWQKSLEVVQELIKNNSLPKEIIKGLAISSQGETLIPVDDTGKPLRKAIVWLDNRSKDEADEIVKKFGIDAILNSTGQPEVLPLWPATRILWIKKHEPSLFEQVAKYCLVEDYLVYKFTGKFVSNPSMLSSTLYFNIVKKQYWQEMLDFLQIKVVQLPSVQSSGMPVGSLTSNACKETGLDASTIVVGGVYDHPAGAIGAGNIDEGWVTETTGASMAMCVTLNEPVFDKAMNLPCQCHAVEGKYFLLPYGQTAGMVLKWFRDQLCYEEIVAGLKEDVDPYKLMDTLAEKVAPGSDGLVALPHLMGTGSPEFNSEVKGVFAGITMETSKGHFIRSILEGVGYMIFKNIELLQKRGIQVKEIRALGGGSTSDLWNQIKADITGIPVTTLASQDHAALGAAILAGVGTGLFSNIAEGCNRMVHPDQTFQPNPEYKSMYNTLYFKYNQLYESLIYYWK